MFVTLQIQDLFFAAKKFINCFNELLWFAEISPITSGLLLSNFPFTYKYLFHGFLFKTVVVNSYGIVFSLIL